VKNWPQDVESELTSAGKEVRQFCSRLQADERKTVRAFTGFIINEAVFIGCEGSREKHGSFLICSI
jgi:hypothetical protein